MSIPLSAICGRIDDATLPSVTAMLKHDPLNCSLSDLYVVKDFWHLRLTSQKCPSEGRIDTAMQMTYEDGDVL